jgi:divinyl chlorophyllide a 8-vinyl-reductase
MTKRRVFVIGCTGTIGQATVQALVRRGHHVVCFVRAKAGVGGKLSAIDSERLFPGATVRVGNVTDPVSLARDGLRGEQFDVLVSCLASRTGEPKDARAIDYQTHMHTLTAVQQSGVTHMVLLSAICVQKPLLAFQFAKLDFERALMDSGLIYSIVRPTAFFKSLSGQVERVKNGKPFLVFGDGALTACKPISDHDLGDYLADCLNDTSRQNRVLPIGGPGPAITPLQQGQLLFKLLGKTPRFRHVPLALLDIIVVVLKNLGKVVPALATKAELARIGRYYATESMLVWNEQQVCYDASTTPSFGTRTLADHYRDLLNGTTVSERGDHAVF